MNRNHLAAFFAVCFAACGGSDEPAQTPADAGVPPHTHPAETDSDKGTLTGTVTLFGRADSSGTQVLLDGAEVARTAADGTFSIADLQAGVYDLSFRNGVSREDVPGVLFLPEIGPLVSTANGLAPLPAIELQHGTRVDSATGVVSLNVDPALRTFTYLTDLVPGTLSGTLKIASLTGSFAPLRLATGVSQRTPEFISEGVILFEREGDLWDTYNTRYARRISDNLSYFLVARPSGRFPLAVVRPADDYKALEMWRGSSRVRRWPDAVTFTLYPQGLVFQKSSPSFWVPGEIYWVPYTSTSGEESLLASGATDVLDVSQDGSVVAYRTDTGIFLKRFDQATYAQLAGSGAHSCSLSESGNHAVWADSAGSYLRDAVGMQAPVTLPFGTTNSLHIVGTTRDGATLVVYGRRKADNVYAAYAVPLTPTIGAPRLLMEGLSGAYAYVVLTPDDSRLLAHANGSSNLSLDLYSIPLAGGGPTLLARDCGWSFTLSPDGSLVITDGVSNAERYGSSATQIRERALVVPVAGGTARELPGVRQWSFSPDGSELLLFEAEDDRRNALRVCRLPTFECLPLVRQALLAQWAGPGKVVSVRESLDPQATFQDGLYVSAVDPFLVDLANDGTTGYSFGRTSDEVKRYQTFVAASPEASPTTVASVEVRLRRFEGATGQSDVTVELFATENGLPTGEPLAKGKISAEKVGAECGTLLAPLTGKVAAGKTYAVVLGQEQPGDKVYEWCTETPSQAAFGKFTGTEWVDESGLGSGSLRVRLAP